MKKITMLLFVIAAALFSGCTVDDDLDVKILPAALAGTWKLTGTAFNGTPAGACTEERLIFAGDTFTWHRSIDETDCQLETLEGTTVYREAYLELYVQGQSYNRIVLLIETLTDSALKLKIEVSENGQVIGYVEKEYLKEN